MKKKLFTAILLVAVVFSLSACGGDKAPTLPTINVPVPPATAEAAAPVPNFVTDYWSAVVGAGLIEDTEKTRSSEYSSYYSLVEKEGDNVKLKIDINVELDADEVDFRNNLVNADLSLQEFAAGTLSGLRDISGTRCYTVSGTGGWDGDYLKYFGHNEAADVNFSISISAAVNDPRVEEFVNSFTLTAPATGNVDIPYPWDGTPYSPTTGSVQVGTYTLTAKWLPFAESFLPKTIWDHRVALAGGYLYVLSEDTLNIYTLSGDTPTLFASNDLGDEYDAMFADVNGQVFISGFMSKMLVYKDGVQTMTLNVEDSSAIHPSGTWGVSYFSDPSDLEKFTISADGGVAKTAFALTDAAGTGAAPLSSISDLVVYDNNIIASGNAADDSGHKLFIFDIDGKHLLTLTDSKGEGMGSITSVVITANGYIALDGNMREILVWNAAGTCIGEIEDSDLFGTSYPWMNGMCRGDDGNIYVCLVDERPDETWDEVLVYRLDTDF